MLLLRGGRGEVHWGDGVMGVFKRGGEGVDGGWGGLRVEFLEGEWFLGKGVGWIWLVGGMVYYHV